MNPIEEGMLEDGDERKRYRKVRSLEQSLWDLRHGGGSGQLLFTREETAAVLRTTPETVDKMVAKGRLRCIQLDEDEPAVFRPEAILELLDKASYEGSEARARARRERDEDDEDD